MLKRKRKDKIRGGMTYGMIMRCILGLKRREPCFFFILWKRKSMSAITSGLLGVIIVSLN